MMYSSPYKLNIMVTNKDEAKICTRYRDEQLYDIFMIESLLKHGCRLTRTYIGANTIHLTTRIGSFDIVKYLVSQGLYIYAPDSEDISLRYMQYVYKAETKSSGLYFPMESIPGFKAQGVTVWLPLLKHLIDHR